MLQNPCPLRGGVCGLASPSKKFVRSLRFAPFLCYFSDARRGSWAVAMPVVVAFVSQKGGVGKSTLARALVTFATRVGLTAKLADLDVQQRTVVAWEQSRQRHNVKPPVRVDAFANAAHALEIATGEDLLILDMPGHITDGTTEVARRSHFLVQPTSPSADDLPISLLVFQALERLGIPRAKLAFALCRVLSSGEERTARSHLANSGYTVLKGAIFEHLRYREAMKIGRSIGETGKNALDARAEVLIGDLLDKAKRRTSPRAHT